MNVKQVSSSVWLAVVRWGNCLAVRLPAEWTKRLGVSEGDTLIGEVAPDRRLTLSVATRGIGPPEVRRMRAFLERQKQSAPVVDCMRRRTRHRY